MYIFFSLSDSLDIFLRLLEILVDEENLEGAQPIVYATAQESLADMNRNSVIGIHNTHAETKNRYW